MAQGQKGVATTRWLWVRSPLRGMICYDYLLLFLFLRSGTKAKAPFRDPSLKTQCLEKFGEKWGTECLNTRFPLPTLLSAGCNVNLIYYFSAHIRVCKGNLMLRHFHSSFPGVKLIYNKIFILFCEIN